MRLFYSVGRKVKRHLSIRIGPPLGIDQVGLCVQQREQGCPGSTRSFQQGPSLFVGLFARTKHPIPLISTAYYTRRKLGH
jgi:hypothetical protein